MLLILLLLSPLIVLLLFRIVGNFVPNKYMFALLYLKRIVILIMFVTLCSSMLNVLFAFSRTTPSTNIALAQVSSFNNHTELEAMFYTAGVEYELNPTILIAIAHIETGGTFDNTLVGSSGELSLMQIMPPMLSWCGLNINNTPEPDEAIRCAAKILVEENRPRYYSKDMSEYMSLTKYYFSTYNAGWPSVVECKCIPNKGYTEGAWDAYLKYMDVDIPYKDGEAIQIASFHGTKPYIGVDYQHVDGFGGELYAPCTGVVAHRGLENWLGPHSKGQKNTMIQITCLDGSEVIMFHGKYIVNKNEFIVKDITHIGYEDAIGNVINNIPHTHFVVR